MILMLNTMSCRKITLPLSLSLAPHPTTAQQVHSSVGGEYRYVIPASPLIILTIPVHVTVFFTVTIIINLCRRIVRFTDLHVTYLISHKAYQYVGDFVFVASEH